MFGLLTDATIGPPDPLPAFPSELLIGHNAITPGTNATPPF
ncbi:MAG TPA: hypothetical protein VGM92_07490 [Candidatus Kapabacteria bacterium]|jgi:hypothetical protein